MATPGERLEFLLPGLQGKNWRITSPAEKRYNCIAWAAGDTTRWWWPAEPLHWYYWPEGVDRAETLIAFQAAFRLLGYEVCETANQEPGFDRIALFADAASLPTHAARQLANGRWSSKLGNAEDIEHDLQDVCGSIYGSVAVLMRRPIPVT